MASLKRVLKPESNRLLGEAQAQTSKQLLTNSYFSFLRVCGSLATMESHRNLYLQLAAEHRLRAETSPEPDTRATLLKLAENYEAAADAIRTYPEAEP